MDAMACPEDTGRRASATTVELLYGDFTEEDAQDKVARFLCSGPPIDAIVAANDLMAVGAIQALAERGVDVPREVSVTGFDDTEDSRFSVPPLTTVRQPAVELGAWPSSASRAARPGPGNAGVPADRLLRRPRVLRTPLRSRARRAEPGSG